jgi:hypothetical protein
MLNFGVVHMNAVFFILPGPLQLWGRSGGSVPQTAEIALLCNKDKGEESEVDRGTARAYCMYTFNTKNRSIIRTGG